MDQGNFERDQIAHEAEDVWTPPTAFFAREDQEFDGLGLDQLKVLRVLVRALSSLVGTHPNVALLTCTWSTRSRRAGASSISSLR